MLQSEGLLIESKTIFNFSLYQNAIIFTHNIFSKFELIWIPIYPFKKNYLQILEFNIKIILINLNVKQSLLYTHWIFERLDLNRGTLLRKELEYIAMEIY
jgi:hypothetical protein